LGIDELKFSIQSEDAVDLGYVAFSKDELSAFIGIDDGM
jgi:hypothetical protein